MRFPATRRDSTTETLHGRQVDDPYRWLEDPDSEETRAWVAEQNRLTRSHLDALPSHRWFLDTMRAAVERPRSGTPDKVGRRYVVTRNDGTQQQDLLFVGDTLEELTHGSRLLIDPNTFSEDGTSALAGYHASRDGRWLAYLVSDGGSDWASIRLLDLGSGREVDDVLSKVKFSEATWLPDHSSYLYLHFPSTGDGVGTEAAALPGGRLCRHYVGESQETDELVLEFPDEPQLISTPRLSHDGCWLAVSITDGTSEKNRLWVYPVHTTSGAATLGSPLKVVDEPRAGFELVRSNGSDLYLLTDLEAPLRRVVRLDLDAFAATGALELVDVVPESEHLIERVEAVGDELLVMHLVDASPRVSRCTLAGAARPVDVPGGALVAVHGDVGDTEVFLGMSSLTRPVVSFRLDLGSGVLEELDLAPAGDTSWRPPTVSRDLLASGVTTHRQLALHGGSNGGLLVGAVLTQHPDLAAVALPAVGVLDMLRFHRFTIGAAWVPDYGSPEDPAMFKVLLGYSPLHNVVPGTSYPATLVLTGDHDDRVVPAHSFKFTAALQHAQAADAPVLARIETSTGHGVGKPSSVIARETADLLAFAAEHTGLEPPG
jgi:prolyl oligopeptidase